MGKRHPEPLADEPKAALAAYIGQFESEYQPWYDKASRRNYYLWLTAQIVAVFAATFSTSASHRSASS